MYPEVPGPEDPRCAAPASRTDHASVGQWIERAASGDDEAFGRLWQIVGDNVARMAESQLRRRHQATASWDHDDAAQSALMSLVSRIRDGRSPPPDGAEELWKLLATIVYRKVRGRARHRAALKRGGGTVMPDSDAVERAAAGTPPADLAAMLAEEAEIRLEQLGDPLLRKLAWMRLEGQTVPEIARTLELSKATIDRKLQRIRAIWGTARDEHAE